MISTLCSHRHQYLVEMIHGSLIFALPRADDICHSMVPKCLLFGYFILLMLKQSQQYLAFMHKITGIFSIGTKVLAGQTGIRMLTPGSQLAGQGAHAATDTRCRHLRLAY